jgi:hypothetical protein
VQGFLSPEPLFVLCLFQQTTFADLFLRLLLYLLLDGCNIGFKFLDSGLLWDKITGNNQRSGNQLGLIFLFVTI